MQIYLILEWYGKNIRNILLNNSYGKDEIDNILEKNALKFLLTQKIAM